MNFKLIQSLSPLGFILLLSLFSGLFGCAQNISPDTYEGSEVGVVSRVKKGVVVSKRLVSIDNNSNVGGVAGVTAGAAAGSMIGHNVQTAIIGAVGGAIVGGVTGNAVEKRVQHHQGYEYIIKLDNNQMISIVQSSGLQFAINQPVLIMYGARTRIIHDQTNV
ncbi:MAG: hypothetical protein H0W64_02825 [Gammaproteobacteria bacterium]|nr:hypothetical protein [Gammaproteobacteria bacterium]